ncbi:MAG TPA: hypothetical protein VF103_05800 [Polyangiaceae bacterium]
MTSPEPDFDSLVAALRADLPSSRDERRVRRRLLAAGIGVTTSVAAPGATAAGLGGGSSLSAALLQKLGALSWTVKIGLAGVAATAALPAAVYLTSAKPGSSPVETPRGAPHEAARPRAPSHGQVPLPVARPSVPIEPGVHDVTPRRDSAHVAPEPVPSSPEPSGAETPASPGLPSSAAFPLDESDAERARSSLGEENALIERGLYALRQGDRDGARRALEEHARRFPNGLLARERDRALARANATDDSPSPKAPATTDSVRTP